MLKAIETRYKGYRFRSRLEARWAVFFDACGVKWEYEAEGYDLGGAGRYLPDFWMPDSAAWIEIKPETPTLKEAQKAYELANLSKKSVLIVAGTPGEEKIWMYMGWGDRVDVVGTDKTDARPVWCLMFGFVSPEQSFGAISPRTSAAYRAARSARFEHGENGNVR